MIKTFFSIIFTFFCFLIFETAILSNLMILPAVPDILLLVTLYIALHNGSMWGQTTGFCSGLMLDFVTAGPFGLNCLLRTLIGFIIGLFNNTVNTSGIWLPAFLAFCTTILKYLLLIIISFFFPNELIKFNIFSIQGIFEILSNTVLAPIIFAFLSLFSSYLIYDNKNLT
ncbi:MAG: rod shape-determining protein MreD [Treponema sp.]|nr:rod shape-determining protein MreD [Treponema sp.]